MNLAIVKQRLVKTRDCNWPILCNNKSRSCAPHLSKWLLFFPLLMFSVSCVSAKTAVNSITIYWTAPWHHGNVDRAAIYDIRYSTDTITDSNWKDLSQTIGEFSPSLPGRIDSFTISNLNSDTWYYIALKSADATLNWSGISNVVHVKTLSLGTGEGEIPSSFALSQNYPNPFNPTTRIDYSLPHTTPIRIDICNLLGQHIVTIVDDTKPAGNYSIVWLGVDSNGRIAPSGVYFYRIRTDDFTETKKMMLVK